VSRFDPNSPDILSVIEDSDEPTVVVRGPAGYGPLLVLVSESGYIQTSADLRSLLTWCLGPGREVLAANGLVILGGSVAP
jgi:hypothetical protein